MAAVGDVRAKKLTLKLALAKYGVPISTISEHARGKILDFKPTGAKRELTDETELALVDYLMYISQAHFSLARDKVRSIIKVNQ